MANTKTKDKTAQLTKALDQQVANFSVLYMKLHHYHWYVKGEQFFTLHLKFEELYKEAGLHFDTIAERMLSLRALPTATLKEQLGLASIKEASGDEDTAAMVKTLAEDFEMICGELTEGITVAEDHDDQPTADMFIAIRTSLEKHRWMLEAFLEG
ncbi:DNA starvation/stationary phase protection protein [Bacillus salipaludis]|uniref:DNA starvation/stationary phase protection protein n=1 Tax=Bacillus salipaludis TaxID=2547811 RepID=A0A4R5VX93_9BACI|nr:DNA starvation/stationary phase protection protein [Bacillus salipaludis]MDQ6595137.1 DNA starvation/stationary phase protection protein [Bacillus salipaludis]TDK64005.1 DNA starvation/stationary phase protection protein [Bacillus salipaludis]